MGEEGNEVQPVCRVCNTLGVVGAVGSDLAANTTEHSSKVAKSKKLVQRVFFIFNNCIFTNLIRTFKIQQVFDGYFY